MRAALAEASQQLTSVSATPRLDAELLMAHALGTSRDQLLLRHLDAETPEAFAALVQHRFAHEPVAYITGTRAFWSIELHIGPGALIPRPDSETLIEAAIGHFRGRAPASILDLGTGPGTLLLAALDQWREARGLGIDASDAALAYARRNAERLGMADRADLRRGNWGQGIDARFDLILCNPPYIETGADLPEDVRMYEPATALFAGRDGLDDYRILAPQIAPLLAPGGIACVEVGAGQAEAVAALFAAQGRRTATRADLAGIARCVTAQ